MKRTNVFDGMNRMFEEMRHSMAASGVGMRHSMAESGFGMEGRFGPDPADGRTGVPVRVETDEEGYLVHADLPGFERDEIDLRFESGVLHVDATHEGSDDGETWRRSVNERLRLPGDVEVDGIEASYRNGVLGVRLPAEGVGESGHRIEIE